MVFAKFDLASFFVICRPGLGVEEDLSRAASQRAAEGCQCVHGRFRMHAVIILDAAMVAPLADKLFRIMLCRGHSLPHYPIHPTIAMCQHHNDSYAIFFASVWSVCSQARMWHTILPHPRDDHITGCRHNDPHHRLVSSTIALLLAGLRSLLGPTGRGDHTL